MIVGDERGEGLRRTRDSKTPEEREENENKRREIKERSNK